MNSTRLLLHIGLLAAILTLTPPRPGLALSREEVRQRSLKRLEQVSDSVKGSPQAENPSGVSLGRPYPPVDVAPEAPAAVPAPAAPRRPLPSGRAAERRTDEAVILFTDAPSAPSAQPAHLAQPAHVSPPGQAVPQATPPGQDMAAARPEASPENRAKATELFRQALAATGKGAFKKALPLLDKAAALNPADPDIFNNRGNVHNNLGNLQKALADYDRAITLRPGDASAHANRGLAHERLGDDAAACRDYRSACDLGDCEFYESFRKEGRCPR